jgi:hypothetical protein
MVQFLSGETTDSRTRAMVAEAERISGASCIVVQGSYSNGSASAGTHSGGGALDLRSWHITNAQRDRLLLSLRKVGFAAWYRTPRQGFDFHFHAIAIGCKDLSSSARNQVTAYYNGRNGLASNGKDDGPRLNPIPTWESYQAGNTLPDTGAPEEPFTVGQYDEIIKRLDYLEAQNKANAGDITYVQKQAKSVAGLVTATPNAVASFKASSDQYSWYTQTKRIADAVSALAEANGVPIDLSGLEDLDELLEAVRSLETKLAVTSDLLQDVADGQVTPEALVAELANRLAA